MFLPAYQSQPQQQSEPTIIDLQSAITAFASQNNVTPDIFFELLFNDAIKYYVEHYYPLCHACDPETANEHLYGRDWKITGSRPKHITFENANLTSDQEQVYLRMKDDASQDLNKFSALNLIWQDIITAYITYKLCAEPLMQKPTIDAGVLTTADLKGTYGGFVKLPVKVILEKFFPIAQRLLPTVMSNPINQQAYSLPDVKINYEQLVEAANAIAATYAIDTHFSDVFEHTLCTILKVPLATKACFGVKEGNYADTKRTLRVELALPQAEVQTLIANANAMQENAIEWVSNQSSEPADMQLFDIQYDFIADFVLPQMAEILQQNPDIVKLCQEQYRINCKDRSYAQFYANYCPVPSQTTHGLRLM